MPDVERAAAKLLAALPFVSRRAATRYVYTPAVAGRDLEDVTTVEQVNFTEDASV